MRCPECKTPDVVRASIAFAEGTARTRSQSVGVGATLGGTIAVGGAATSGTMRTLTASWLSPPPKPPGAVRTFLVATGMGFVFYLGAGLVSVLIMITSFGDKMPERMIFVFPLIIIASWTAAYWIWFRRRARMVTAYPGLAMAWERQWYCTRCGYTADKREFEDSPVAASG